MDLIWEKRIEVNPVAFRRHGTGYRMLAEVLDQLTHWFVHRGGERERFLRNRMCKLEERGMQRRMSDE